MKTITVNCLVDVVAALSDDTLTGNLFLTDDNRPPGEPRRASDMLTTAVKAGDVLVWVCQVLDIETQVSIEGIWGMPADVCAPALAHLPNTDAWYWWGAVQRDFTDVVPYWLYFKVEGRSMRAPLTSSLICQTPQTKGA
jgi:hypothetical protein